MSDGVRYNLAPTDVIDDMMDNFGFQQQHNVSVTGGSSKATYRVSFGMMDEDGILVTDKDSYKRYNASAFVSMDANKWLTLQADFRYTDSKTSIGPVRNFRTRGKCGLVICQQYAEHVPAGL